jgi:DNA-directed RNA polymerase subunit N (RpoN/RPB10)
LRWKYSFQPNLIAMVKCHSCGNLMSTTYSPTYGCITKL